MAPRSNWKGYLKLSLVSASIAIYPATSATEKVSFNTLNRATGNRLKRQMVDSVTGDVVESDEQVKGYAVAKDQHVMVEADELAEIAIESSHTVDIEKFVPKASIDDRYRDTPYYLAPEDQVGQEAFAVIRDAMKKKKMVGIARVVMARRERVMMLEPFGKGLMGTTLLYPYEIRGEDAAFEDIPDIKLPEQMVKLAEDIIDRMTGEFEPDKFEDRYEQAMIELIRSKQAGLPAPKEKATPRPANVVNLMEALRKSVEGSTSKAKASAKKAEPTKKEEVPPEAEGGKGMSPLSKFEMALRGLLALDMQELVDAGAISDRDYPAWDAFEADRVKWLLAHPVEAQAVWLAIWRHINSEPSTVDTTNLVELDSVRSRKR